VWVHNTARLELRPPRCGVRRHDDQHFRGPCRIADIIDLWWSWLVHAPVANLRGITDSGRNVSKRVSSDDCLPSSEALLFVGLDRLGSYIRQGSISLGKRHCAVRGAAEGRRSGQRRTRLHPTGNGCEVRGLIARQVHPSPGRDCKTWPYRTSAVWSGRASWGPGSACPRFEVKQRLGA